MLILKVVDKQDIRRTLDEIENVVGFLNRFPQQSHDSAVSAIKSVGYHIQQDFKKTGEAGSRYKWERRSPFTLTLNKGHKTKNVDVKRYKTGKRKGMIRPKKGGTPNPLARLMNTTRYQLDAGDSVGSWVGVRVGFFKHIPASLMDIHESERKIRVTDKMRRFFFASGAPMKKTTKYITIPSRKWYTPVKAEWGHDKTIDLFAEKYFASMRRKGILIT